MSGICGIYYLDGRPVDPVELTNMVDILAHRGPDGAHIWHDGPVGLGHRMLWTTPESLTERLPYERNGLVITADARIDNRDELIATLGLTGRPAGEMADSQLILAAYEKWGESCPEKLIGDFAFVVWDSRKQVLFSARDPMGIRAFYYYHSASAFVFASEIKAILALAGVPQKLNETKVADFLLPTFDDKIITYYQDIFRLPPAYSLTVSKTGSHKNNYWALDPKQELRLHSDDDYIEAFLELFTETVRCRLRSTFPMGSTLSGGLDSSSIACIATKILQEGSGLPLHTFSAIFPSVAEKDPRIDERPYMEAVLPSGQFFAHFVHADKHVRPLADVLQHKDEVIPAPNLYMDKAIFKACREQGVRVILSGFDGDSTISYGLEYLDELASAGNWSLFAKEINVLSNRTSISTSSYLRGHGLPHLTRLARHGNWVRFILETDEISRYFNQPRWNTFLDYGLKPLIPTRIRQLKRLFNGQSQFRNPIWGLNSAINPEFVKNIGLTQRINTSQSFRSLSTKTFREEHIHSINDGMLQYAAETFDQVAAVFSVEQRYPFFDRRLIEFCVALPIEQKLAQGWTRSILRLAMKDILPQEVRWRIGKGNLSSNVRLRLLEEREALEQVILNDNKIIEKYINVPMLQVAYYRYLSQPVLSTEQDLFTVFLSVNLAYWLRQSKLTAYR